MAKPQIRVHNLSTDEVIDREMTSQELSDYNEMVELIAQEKADREAKAAQKAALLERLGITQDEANLLLS